MHSVCWANASPSMDEYADPDEPDEGSSLSMVCRLPGCGAHREKLQAQRRSSTRQGGQGYCAKHYRALCRHGHPLGLAFKAWEDLQDAVLRMPEKGYDVGAEIALARAAVRYAYAAGTNVGSRANASGHKAPVRASGVERDVASDLAAEGLVSEEFRWLRANAKAYRDCDVYDDAAFKDVEGRLKTAAVKFFRFLVTP